MIRYVKIGDQICGGLDQFAFYDTVTDRFLDPGGEHVFDSRADLIWYVANDPGFRYSIERLLKLIPEGAHEHEDTEEA